jgi:uncharacterized protein (TIGR02300 family)
MIEGGVMPKEEWGVKRVCPTTGKRFYDLGRSPIVSPYSGEVVEIETGKGGRSLTAEKTAKPAAKAKKEEPEEDLVLEDDIEIEDDDDDDVDIDDDDVLDDDDDSDTVALDDLADVAADDDDS